MEKEEISQEVIHEEFSYDCGEEEEEKEVVEVEQPKTISIPMPLHRSPKKPLHLHRRKEDSVEPSPSGRSSREEPPSAVEKEGRERVKRRRVEEVGRGGVVKVPDKWSQEELLKEWIDYSTFDALLAPKGLASAREALIAERRRARGLRIQGTC